MEHARLLLLTLSCCCLALARVPVQSRLKRPGPVSRPAHRGCRRHLNTLLAPPQDYKTQVLRIMQRLQGASARMRGTAVATPGAPGACATFNNGVPAHLHPPTQSCARQNRRGSTLPQTRTCLKPGRAQQPCFSSQAAAPTDSPQGVVLNMPTRPLPIANRNKRTTAAWKQGRLLQALGLMS